MTVSDTPSIFPKACVSRNLSLLPSQDVRQFLGMWNGRAFAFKQNGFSARRLILNVTENRQTAFAPLPMASCFRQLGPIDALRDHQSWSCATP